MVFKNTNLYFRRFVFSYLFFRRFSGDNTNAVFSGDTIPVLQNDTISYVRVPERTKIE